MTRRAEPPVVATPTPEVAGGAPPRLLEAPGYLARRLYGAYVAVWARVIDSSLTGPQFAVLHTVSEYPAVDQGSLAAAVALDRSTMADIAARLEERGLLWRAPDPGDARRKLLSLTGAGQELLREVDRQARALDERLWSGRSAAERAAMLQMLQDLSAEWVQIVSDLSP